MRKNGQRVTASHKRGIGFTQKLTIPGEMIWESHKPRFNGWQSGHGAHKSAKDYDRKAMKRELRREVDDA